MGGTRPEADGETTSGLTPLAHGIKHIDTKFESRDCPHECHGTLTVTDSDRVVCRSCRCTPDGVYLPPTRRDGGSATPSSGCQPQGSRVETYPPATRRQMLFCTALEEVVHFQGEHPWAESDRERYRHSGEVVLAGGFEEAYPQERTSREDSLI